MKLEHKIQEDWQPDVDENGVMLGVCPKCEGDARFFVETENNKFAARFYCVECEHSSKPTFYL